MAECLGMALNNYGFMRFAGNALDVGIVINASGTILAASQSASPLLGYPLDALVGRNVVDFILDRDIETASRLLSTAGEIAGTTRSVDIRILHHEGHWIPHEVLPLTLLATEGIIVLTCRNISERLRIQEERITEELRFRALAMSVPIAIFQLTNDGFCEFVNQRWTELTGQPMDEAAGAGWINVIDRTDQLKLVEVQSGTAATGVMDLRLHGHNGQHRSIIGRWSALFDTEGQRTGFVGTMEDVTERKTLEERLVHQATHDALTGLPNRLILNEHLAYSLARAKRTHERVGVIFCDLDRFKIVNDSLGHETGDRLLKAVARRMSTALRETDVVGRFGGDEFVVLVSGPDESAIREAANRLQAIFAEPFDIGLGRPYASSGSIGIALSTPESTPETLLRDADVAMYRAKERGRGRAEEFDERLRARALDRLALMSDLPHALANNELVLLYQPILGTPACQIFSVEALVRWDHPTRGRLSPDVFIGLAEETGLILPIGDWILEHACRELLPVTGVMLNVNLSSLQVDDPGLVDRVAAALQRTGFPGSRLMLEITESVLMQNVEKTVETLRGLKALGVSIAVDDFGTGYSSLNYLSSFPIDSLKVDRSFIQGLGFHAESDREIVRTVIALAHSLGLRATAEGVETDAQLAALRLLGCDFVQGFLFDEPVTLDVLCTNWITSSELLVTNS
jgi:diguanylate cyclase (GGDEF)-like protein/PAS domain S-box-containing protein